MLHENNVPVETIVPTFHSHEPGTAFGPLFSDSNNVLTVPSAFEISPISILAAAGPAVIAVSSMTPSYRCKFDPLPQFPAYMMTPCPPPSGGLDGQIYIGMTGTFAEAFAASAE